MSGHKKGGFRRSRLIVDLVVSEGFEPPTPAV